ncbi:unnamed protein product [Urochloa decumbens]|uniref:Gnk2-homologous domain-containing protein n=1 Tax=Urochloa decumbens TaxID=240449 RepID=A0ABC8YX16_9POAL
MRNLRILLLLCWSLRLAGTANADDLVWPRIPYCPQDNMNYTRGDAFQANLNALLSSLPTAAATSSGFVTNTSVATATPDQQASGIVQCRADITPSDCLACLNNTAREMAEGGACQGRKNAMLVHEGCLLRYSNASFFGAPDTGDPIFSVGNVQNDVSTQPEKFASRLSALMGNLTWKAAYGSPRKFAVGEVYHAAFVTIYGMARCTEDMGADDCYLCLEIVVKTIPKCCSGKEGGRVFARSCSVRFEVYRFYNEEAAEAAMSPASPPAPGGGGRVNGSDHSASPTKHRLVVLAL